LVIAVFFAAVIISALTFRWSLRSRIRYLRLRQRSGDVPPFAKREVIEEAYRRPWTFPIRVGALWRAQTAWDRVTHADPVLAAARRESERHQKLALVVYVACLAAIFVAAEIGR